MKQMVQSLQLALEKEKTKVMDLKEQVRLLCCILGQIKLLFKLKYNLKITHIKVFLF